MTSRAKIFGIAAASFLTLWLTIFTSSFLAAHCLDPDTEIPTKVTICKWAARTSLGRYVEADHPEYAAIAFERAIALAEHGESAKSISAMRDLLAWANTGRPASRSERDIRVATIIASRARLLERHSKAYFAFAEALSHDPA